MDRFTTSMIVMALAYLSLTACATLSPRSDPSRFFTLAPMTQDQEAGTRGPSIPSQLSLGIGPIRFPGYLDREQIVSRVSQQRFDLSENDRWAEPLEENFARVLSQNLSVLLHTDQIVRYPWQTSHRPTYQVEIEVLRFESNRSQEAQLAVRWNIIDPSMKKLISSRESRLIRQARATSTEATVAALSETLGELSREIADAVKAAERQRTQ